MTPSETSETPPRERALLGGEVRFVAMVAVACLFGLITRVGKTHWPLWVNYPLQLFVALVVGLALGISQEAPDKSRDVWRPLRWRSVLDTLQNLESWPVFLAVSPLAICVRHLPASYHPISLPSLQGVFLQCREIAEGRRQRQFSALRYVPLAQHTLSALRLAPVEAGSSGLAASSLSLGTLVYQ